MNELGFLMRGQICWCKGGQSRHSTAWGSYMSPSNPVLRGSSEYVLVFSKDKFDLENDSGGNPTADASMFCLLTRDEWDFPTAKASAVGHPAPFPEELPERCIHLYTFSGQNVLDPFCGSGTTLVAARKLGRNFVGYDIDPEYIKLTKKNLSQTLISDFINCGAPTRRSKRKHKKGSNLRQLQLDI